MCSHRCNDSLTCADGELVTRLLSMCLLYPALPVTWHPSAGLCVWRSSVFVVQQIIHVLSGQLHLANAPLPSKLAAADHLCASVKWPVNIDSETARGKQRPCQKGKESKGDGGGRWSHGEKEKSKRWIKRRGSCCLLPRQLNVL